VLHLPGGVIVFKAQRLLYHSTLGRKSVISYISWDLTTPVIRLVTFQADKNQIPVHPLPEPPPQVAPGLRFQGLGLRVQGLIAGNRPTALRRNPVTRWKSVWTHARKVDVRLPGKGNSNSYGARPVHLIITMIKWIRTSRLLIQNSLPEYTTISSRGWMERVDSPPGPFSFKAHRLLHHSSLGLRVIKKSNKEPRP